MIINNSSIKFSTNYDFFEKHTIKESININLNMPRENIDNILPKRPNKDIIEISSKSSNLNKIGTEDNQDEASLTPELRMIKLLLEKLIMQKINITQIDTNIIDNKEIDKIQSGSKNQINLLSIEYQYDESYYQFESSAFSAKGIIYTSDDQKINFEINFALKKELLIENNINISIGKQKTKDPLILNFDGTTADLSDIKFIFDIDSDGKSDMLPFVASGSGFLAIDQNNDRKINDGSELFGPKTGNGFDELKDYDSDNNHWIDEKDPIYDKLLIWTKDNKGNDSITEIKQKGIGAIYLGYEATPFKINGKQDNFNGLLKSSSIYINENGSVGTIQQIDLVT